MHASSQMSRRKTQTTDGQADKQRKQTTIIRGRLCALG